MLVLSRKVGEEILIGDGITVKVLSVHGDKVRIGLVAPAETRVLRGELKPRELPGPISGEFRETDE